MKYPIKFILGIVYILYKAVAFVLVSIIYTIWSFDFSFYKDLYKEMFDTFFMSHVINLENWRYITFSDFIHNRKCYDHSDWKLKPQNHEENN